MATETKSKERKAIKPWRDVFDVDLSVFLGELVLAIATVVSLFPLVPLWNWLLLLVFLIIFVVARIKIFRRTIDSQRSGKGKQS